LILTAIFKLNVDFYSGCIGVVPKCTLHRFSNKQHTIDTCCVTVKTF